MAMTVTATMSGTAANEHIYLWIRVLTAATEAGGASATGIAASGGAGVTASLTPNFSNSLPCYALSGDNSAGPLTAAGSNTIDSSSADPDTWEAGFGRYTGTVTAATPLTFGASSFGVGGCDYGTWACYEVPSSGGGTPAVDASSPALASATGAGIKTVTSASFTPPAGAVVVAMICGGGTGVSGSMVMTVTGGGLTWTQRAGNATVTDQDTFVFTATAAGGAAPGQASAAQLPWPPALTQVFGPGAPFTGTSFRLDPAPQAQVTAGLATGAGAAASPSFSLYITGLGGVPGTGYFQDQNSAPRLVWGDAVWALCGNVGRWSSGAWQADYDTYLATRQAQGVNVLYTKPMGTQQSGNIDNNGGTFDSLFPFQGGSPSTGTAAANPSSGLTAAYWARIDYMLASAAARGITVFLNAIGYSSDFDSGPGPLAGKSATEFTAYGTALGARYASTPNLVWNLADDYFGDNDSLVTAFLTGLRGAGDTHAVSIENFPETMSRLTVDGAGTHAAWGFANAQYNFVYSYNVIYYGVELGYTLDGTVPVIAGDGYFYQGNATYSGGSGAFAFDRAFRQDAWHALTSGARGKVHGDESVWQWQAGSQSAAAAGWFWANSALAIRTAFEALAGWQNLVPDTGSALVTGGRGTHASAFSSGGGGGQYEVAFTDSYVTASRTPDSGSGSSLAVVYLSHGTTITIDQTKLASGYTATWIDPVSGATSPATAGTTYNSTAKGSNSQGDPDWVLAFQAPAGASAAAGLASGTGAAQAPAASAGVNGTLAEAAGTAQPPAAAAGVNATAAAGAGTAQNAVAAAGVNAVAATGTGTAQNATASTTSSGTASAVLAAGAGAAQSPAVTAAASVTAVPATGAGTAQGPSAAAGASAAAATGTGAAQSAAAATAAAVTAVLASGAGTAQGATASTSSAGNASAGLPSGTGTAQAPAAAVTAAATAAAATGSGTAQGATGQASRTVSAGLATGAGAAQNPATALTALAHASAAHALAAALGATAAAQGAFTVGTLTASDRPAGALASAAAVTPQSTLTASDTRTGGPS